MAKSEDDQMIEPLDGPESIAQEHRVEPFVLALTLALGVGAVALAVLTRKHLFARQIAPADSPIQVM
jgi:hypothetical protein